MQVSPQMGGGHLLWAIEEGPYLLGIVKEEENGTESWSGH